MSEKVNFQLVSPEKSLISGSFDMVIVPGEDGDMGVLPQHSHLASTLRPGVITIVDGNEKKQLFVSGGFVDIQPDSCTVLSDEATLVSDFDKSQIEKSIKHLKEDIEDSKEEYDRKQLEKSLHIEEQKLVAVTSPQYLS